MVASRLFSKISRKGSDKKAALKRLEHWIDDTTQAFQEYLSGGLTDAEGNLKGGRIFAIDVDASVFSKEELASVAKKIEALHDICRTLDVHFEVAGFDLLPHSHTLIMGSASSG